jgi:hypothetical protein
MPVILGGNTGIYLASLTPSVDPDAQAFITAAAITDPTQQAAINTLVVDLKGYNVWSKMKALYPFVGGTAAQHKFNLKDPRDLDAAFRLTFATGWTHSSTGATPNGATFADTFFNTNTSASLNNHSLSYYSRTNATNAAIEIGVGNTDLGIYNILELRTTNTTYFGINGGLGTYTDSDSRAFYLANRQASNDLDLWKQGVKVVNGTTASSSLLNGKIYLGAMNSLSILNAQYYSTKQCAFASIGDGLTDTEAANFYTAVQNFQVSLGRSIGTQTVSDADAQAFVTNAGIVDQVEANAINNLVIGMKADGLWTKSHALYPLVGGTATTMKFNLKNPLDTDAAFRAIFNGGWTYSNNGILGNASNSFADTKFNPTTVGVDKSNFGVSIYSRSNVSGYKADIGAVESPASYIWLIPRYDSVTDFAGSFDDSNFNGNYLTNTLGLISVVRDSATTQKLYQAGVQKGTRTGFSATGNINKNIYFGARNNVGVAANYTDRQYALIAIHEAFNATEMINFNTRVTTFQTALSRNI